MWKRTPREALAQSLYDTAGDLQTLARQLMALSMELAEGADERAAPTTIRRTMTLQERQAGLSKHVDRFTKTGNLGNATGSFALKLSSIAHG